MKLTNTSDKHPVISYDLPQLLKILSPYDGHLIETLPLASAEEIEDALATAYELFTNRAKRIPKYRLIGILEKVVELMQERADEFAKTISEEGGKPCKNAKTEVGRAINGVKLAIQQLGELGGKEIPMGLTPFSTHHIAFTVREPVGVVVAVSAFNDPLNLIIHQVIPAVAVGCPVIVKPALTTPLSCLKFVNTLYEAGLPEEWCQMALCENEIAEKLVSDCRVHHFSFVGSAKVGWHLHSKLAAGTSCTLEHGGVAPVIVEPDVDIDAIIMSLVNGAFSHAGQSCISVQKIFAHTLIAKPLAEKIALAATKLKVGDPMDIETEVGPLILPREADRVAKWVNEAVEKGGKLLCGGKKLSNNAYAPTVILNPPSDVKVSKEEVFGPVVCIYSYKDRLDAIHIANSLPFIFQAAVFTKNIDIALDTVQRLNATTVMVNEHTDFRVDWMPFGGRGVSGIGLAGIPYSMRELTKEKLMMIKSDVIE